MFRSLDRCLSESEVLELIKNEELDPTSFEDGNLGDNRIDFCLKPTGIKLQFYYYYEKLENDYQELLESSASDPTRLSRMEPKRWGSYSRAYSFSSTSPSHSNWQNSQGENYGIWSWSRLKSDGHIQLAFDFLKDVREHNTPVRAELFYRSISCSDPFMSTLPEEEPAPNCEEPGEDKFGFALPNSCESTRLPVFLDIDSHVAGCEDFATELKRCGSLSGVVSYAFSSVCNFHEEPIHGISSPQIFFQDEGGILSIAVYATVEFRSQNPLLRKLNSDRTKFLGWTQFNLLDEVSIGGDKEEEEGSEKEIDVIPLERNLIPRILRLP